MTARTIGCGSRFISYNTGMDYEMNSEITEKEGFVSFRVLTSGIVPSAIGNCRAVTQER